MALNNATQTNESAARGVPIPTPQSITSVLDDAFDLLKRYFFVLILPTALLMLPTHLLLTLIQLRWLNPALADLQAQGDNADALTAIYLAIGYIFVGSPTNAIPGLIGLFIPLLASGATCVIVADILAGRQMSVAGSLLALSRRAFSVLACSILGMLCTLVVLTGSLIVMIVVAVLLMIALTAVSVVTDGLVPPALGTVIVLVCVVVPYFVTTYFLSRTFLFSVPAAVLEKLDALEAPNRSAQLAKCARAGGIVSILPFTIILLQIGLSAGINTVIGMSGFSPQMLFVAGSAAAALVSCTVQTYWMVFIARLYFNARMSREALDIRILLAQEAQS